MAMRESQREYEQILKILSAMEYHKPVALVTISQKTGVKLADIIRLCTVLIKDGLVERTMDNSTIFYILQIADYEEKASSLYEPEPEEPVRPAAPKSSREEILKRRAMRSRLSSEMNERVDLRSMQEESVQRPKVPERLSAVDLLAMKRSSTMNARVFAPGRSSAFFSKVPSTPNMDGGPGLSSTQNLSLSDSFRVATGISGTAHKAVYINRPSSHRGSNNSRSTFAAVPPANLDPLMFERSDTNFKMRNPNEVRSTLPLIPFTNVTSESNEIPEEEVLQKLGIAPNAPMIAILTPRPCHELWSAFSAIANAGGGTIVLGMRKYINYKKATESEEGEENEVDDVTPTITYFVKQVKNPEESVKVLLRNFNDRNNISDCPKDPNFLEIVEFGRKKVIVVHIDPKNMSGNPVYTAKDSFNMRTTQGCYLYRHGEIVHCTKEEIMDLWQRRRLGNEVPDWEQTGEVLPVSMEHKMKLHLPQIMNDAVRPLSSGVDSYGKPIPERMIPASMRGYSQIHTNEYQRQTHFHPAPTSAAEEASREAEMAIPARIRSNDEAFRTSESRSLSSSSRRAVGTPMSSDELTVVDALTGTTSMEPKKSRRDNNIPDAAMLQKLLFAEDIRVGQSTAPERSSHSPSCAVDDPSIPPAVADMDRTILDEIAEPAVSHPRIPATRLCEIAVNLCRHARIKPSEFADILHRKYQVIQDKLLPKLKENPHIHVKDCAYYYSESEQ